jgi:UDP-3-O-[3-hydroxymyristoyl] N-acetylglucosamine deacetylase
MGKDAKMREEYIHFNMNNVVFAVFVTLCNILAFALVTQVGHPIDRLSNKVSFLIVESMGVASKGLKSAASVGLPLEPKLIVPAWQQTIGGSVSCTGIGLHTGKPAALTLRPATPNSGYVFMRTDIPESSRRIPARWDTVTDTAMCTKITNSHGVSVSTIEHVIAALAGYDIHNAIIELDGPEVPVMDGSSSDFVDMIRQASVRQQREPVRRIKILKTVEVKVGKATATLKPSDESKFTMHFNANGRLANQAWSFNYYPDHDDFGDLLSCARTFGFYEDAQHLWDQGLAQGASLDNAVIIKDGKVMNEEGLRFADEFVRHKMLDAIGDLALAGAPIQGSFSGENSGHGLNNQLLRALFADKSAWSF